MHREITSGDTEQWRDRGLELCPDRAAGEARHRPARGDAEAAGHVGGTVP